MAILPTIPDSFIKEQNEFNSIKISQRPDGFYYTVSNCIIYDSVAKKYTTEIINLNKSIKINTDLTQSTSRLYIYIECNIDQTSTFKITKSSIIDSTKLLLHLDKNKARALIGIIGINGKKCSPRPPQPQYLKDCIPSYSFNDNYNDGSYENRVTSQGFISRAPIRTAFGLLNGLPIVYLTLDI